MSGRNLVTANGRFLARSANSLPQRWRNWVTIRSGAQTRTKRFAELAKGRDRFDLVFTDVVMPGRSGIELAEELRRLYPALPVVLTSGYSDVLAEHGSSDFALLHKPYSVDEFKGA